MKQFRDIPLTEIRGPSRRDRFAINEDAVKSLADDIAQNGLINPILVRKNGEAYEVVAGERRFLAVQLLGWERVACHVQVLDDKSAAFLRAVENLGREDLSPVEEGSIYQHLINDLGLTALEVGKRCGKSVGVVKRRLDLLSMPECLQVAIHKGAISYGVAEELWRFADPAVIEYYLGWCVDHGATVKVVRDWVRDHRRAGERDQSDVVEGGGVSVPVTVAPSYISCGVCEGPVVLGREYLLRVCGDCFEKIKVALRG